MSAEDVLQYHTARARNELDLGLTAPQIVVARAHMQLAALHMQRVRELSGNARVQEIAPLGA
jgi:hypothetical protein